MKFYQPLIIMVTLLCSPLQAEAFWTKWIDNIAAKINNVTDVILHKEFTHAKKLELHNLTGTIVINSWKQNSIAIEVIISCTESLHKDIKVDMECIEDIIKIHTIFHDEKIKASIVFNILVPKDTQLNLTTHQGDIIIKDVDSTLQLLTHDGDIKLVNPHTSLHATTMDGDIIIRTDSIDEKQEFSLISHKGNIEIYSTQALNTYVHAYAPQGKVTSELFITLDTQTTLLNPDAWKNFKQIVHGVIGQPLSQLHMTTENGSISIMPSMKQNDIF